MAKNLKENLPPDAEPKMIDCAGGGGSCRLVYAGDELPGYSRAQRRKRQVYLDPDGAEVKDPELIARFDALVIPPAWTDVWISPFPEGHLQATGRDARGRKQYIYHPHWEKLRDEKKYGSLVAFGRALPLIRSRIDSDLRLRGLPRNKVLALVISLLDTTLLRIGNPEYARANQSYGLTTLEDSHVDVSGSRIRIAFKGKGGKQQLVGFKSRRLAKWVRRCQELPGQRLFQYLDDDGTLHSLESSDVNTYLREITGQDLSAKDFRTWGATVRAARLLMEAASDSERSRRRIINTCIREVARKLGNTISTCRKYYVHPAVLAAFERGLLAEIFERASRKGSAPASLSTEEAAVLFMLETSKSR